MKTIVSIIVLGLTIGLQNPAFAIHPGNCPPPEIVCLPNGLCINIGDVC